MSPPTRLPDFAGQCPTNADSGLTGVRHTSKMHQPTMSPGEADVRSRGLLRGKRYSGYRSNRMIQRHVLIVDDHQILRQGLKSLLEKEPDLKVVAEAEDGRTAIEIVQSQPIDLVIMDVAMPALNGMEATRKILAVNPGLKVIGLSMHTDRRFVTEMLRA